MTSPEYAAEYSYIVLCGRTFPRGEATIATSGKYSLNYACNAQTPFPKGEYAIATSARYSYWYAREVLKGPFPLGEPAIRRDTFFWDRYQKMINDPDFFKSNHINRVI